MGGFGCMGENRQGRKRLKARRGNGWVILSMGVIATQTKEEWQMIKQLKLRNKGVQVGVVSVFC